ncbi:MAG: NYN domain-containing protein [Candidatus Lokiarchaeota archaeon]|nr:NYN domain-containing protein [Candidatus Lokiarchaeota archaeon]
MAEQNPVEDVITQDEKTLLLHVPRPKRSEKKRRKRKRGVISNTKDPTLSVIDLKIYAANKGGKCLDSEYRSPREKMHWKCKYGHTWEASLNQVHGGNWCPVCGGKKRRKTSKRRHPKSSSKKAPRRRKRINVTRRGTERAHIYRKFERLINSIPGRCLSPKFLGWTKPHQWSCSCGNVFIETPEHIDKGRWCPICTPHQAEVPEKQPKKHASCPRTSVSRKPGKKETKQKPSKLRKKDLSGMAPDEKLIQMRQLAEEHGGTCLSDAYINLKTKLLWECSKGHKFYKTPDGVKHKGAWCNKCKGIFKRFPDNIPPSDSHAFISKISKSNTRKSPQKGKNKRQNDGKKNTSATRHSHKSPSKKELTPSKGGANAKKQPYALYAFDLNNLTVRYRECFPHANEDDSPVQDILLCIWRTTGTDPNDFTAWWFVSENHRSGLRALKGQKGHKVFVESHFKNGNKSEYMDIDTVMSAKMAEIIATDRDTISRFYLGSGDKDFYYLIQLAHQYNIPVTVIGTTPHDVGRELKHFADEFIALF